MERMIVVKNTVVVLNEVMASMTLAFKKAGFKIVASYENDAKVCDIYKFNIEGTLIEEDIFKTDIIDIPEADVMVGKLMCPPCSIRSFSHKTEHSESFFERFHSIFSLKHPKVFMLEGHRSMVQREEFQQFLSDLAQEGYQISYKEYDVYTLTGLPVNERKLYIIGVRTNLGKAYAFLEKDYIPLCFEKDILEQRRVDEWYDKITSDLSMLYENMNIDSERFLCWTQRGYSEKDKVSWNARKVPLVNVDGKIRKLSHREVARLKGYPDAFELRINKYGKYWLYQKLMGASNIYVVYQIAKSIEYVLNDDDIRNQQVVRAIQFEKFVGQYLKEKFSTVETSEERDIWGDFQVNRRDNKIHIEVKIYRNKNVEYGNILRICQQLSIKDLDTQDSFILIVGNIVKKEIKQKCRDEYGIFIWDIANVLFLFDEFPNIKNEFVALLNYTINEIEPEEPVPNMIEGTHDETGGNNLYKRLEHIKPGVKEFQSYEKVCIEILKEVFGESLTLWAEQRKSNQGLYRFDLCCKIKHGENQEFFDTVKRYFNTKYIVFEFKNYAELITPKEIYSTEKYLYKTALRCVAIIIARKGASERALTAARGCLRENGKLILCLSDEDLIQMMDIKLKEQRKPAEYLSDMLDDMLINLEK